jgi:hypothetical protein
LICRRLIPRENSDWCTEIWSSRAADEVEHELRPSSAAINGTHECTDVRQWRCAAFHY